MPVESETPPGGPDLVVLSDLHLGEGLRSEQSRFSPMEDFFYDDAFARLLSHLEQKYADRPDALVLILNGDVFDFLTVTRVPTAAEAKAVGFAVSAAERRFGLNPTPCKSCYKLDRIIDGHPIFFGALARFVARGYRVEVLRGNHDLEIFFPEVQQRLFERLGQLDGGPTEAQLAERVRFHQLYYLEPGRVYVEHGNQYEASNSIRYPLRPVVPERRRRREKESVLDYPLGSMFVRYFYNSVHRINPHTPKVISFEQYVEFLRRHNFLDLLRVAKAHYPFFARAVGGSLTANSAGPSQERDAKQEESFAAAESESEAPDYHRQISELKIHPLSSSKAELAKQMMAPLARRLIWVAGLSFGALYVWLLIFNLIQATPWLAENVFFKAVLLVLFAVLTMVGLFWTGNYLAHKMRRQTDEVVEMCAVRAEQIAKLTGARVVLMGHTHVVDVRPIQEGRAIYLNSGTWTAVDNPWDRLHPDARRFTMVRVRADRADVCRWNDDAGRIDPVPMFDLPEDRDIPPPVILARGKAGGAS